MSNSLVHVGLMNQRFDNSCRSLLRPAPQLITGVGLAGEHVLNNSLVLFQQSGNWKSNPSNSRQNRVKSLRLLFNSSVNLFLTTWRGKTMVERSNLHQRKYRFFRKP